MSETKQYPDEIGRIMPVEEQLRRWVAGESVHNGATRGEGECCPDFSCCEPEMKASPEIRRRFAEANPDLREKMLGMFLGGMVAEKFGEKVHVSDVTEGEA